ncbi:MAG: hypothetical protein BA866_06495 [Desulfobulbaceae bacterium S5133MH15]|nr:MAG: hypothetical protein BA866_06495 [Desulfobulbaceae bacterium S5133MH15]OEU83408.1 MAG: hypothetical protein BA873_13830 [Desulfobulbaceae bacterium C00003063]
MNLTFLRWSIISIRLSVLIFLALGTLSAYYYPGGNYISKTEQSYSFWNNFICDSFRDITCTGQTNFLGARLASLAMLVLILGAVFPIFYAFPYQLSKKVKLNRTIRWIGLFAVGVAALLPLSSLFKMPIPHDSIVVIATIPALIAAFLLFLTTLTETSSSRWVKVIGFLMLTIAMVNMILYLRVQWFGSPLTALLPGTQKVVLLLSLAWMFSLTTTLDSRRRGKLGHPAGTIGDTFYETIKN